MAKSIMIQGTASGVGKTIITIALCRIFKQDGFKAAPFKAQNMTSNTARTESGEEMAVSQILQARAAGIKARADMNPIVLKPLSAERKTELILRGRHYDYVDAYGFKDMRKNFIPEIRKAYEALAEQYDIIVIEGAGSPAELNLKKDDIANMGIAKLANAPVLLVSDIDRGGSFASLYGTLNLLEEDERAYIKAVLLNRFKGDISYFAEGAEILKKITGLPLAGIVPYIKINIPEEDDLYNKPSLSHSKADDFGNIDSNKLLIEGQIDLIADNVRGALDMGLIYKIVNEGMNSAL